MGCVSKTYCKKDLMAAVKTDSHSSLIIHSGPSLQWGKTILKHGCGTPKVKKTLFFVFCLISLRMVFVRAAFSITCISSQLPQPEEHFVYPSQNAMRYLHTCSVI